jgi:hypothetical protein
MSVWDERSIGTAVPYRGELPCDEAVHAGEVIAVADDASEDKIITVRFSCCGVTQDIPASGLGEDERRDAWLNWKP